MKGRVLVVDDDAALAEMLGIVLRGEGFEPTFVADGDRALEAFRETRPDLILLDLMLPGMDGIDVCRQIRAESGVPIVMLTAKSDTVDVVLGLESGADDYIVKPFSPKELVARVRAVLRRWDGARGGMEVVRAGDLTLDVPRMQACIGDRMLNLTPTEFQLLAVMARQPGRIFTRGQLLEAVHGVAIESYERAIDSHIKNIRRKVEPDPHHPRYVLAVHGIGYKFAEE